MNNDTGVTTTELNMYLRVRVRFYNESGSQVSRAIHYLENQDCFEIATPYSATIHDHLLSLIEQCLRRQWYLFDVNVVDEQEQEAHCDRIAGLINSGEILPWEKRVE